MRNNFFIFFFFLLSFSLFGQKLPEKKISERKKLLIEDPLTPSINIGKSSKVPFVYGAIGASVYGYVYNQKEMDRYRTAYKRRLAGFQDDEFKTLIPDNSKLIEGMKFHKSYRDMSFLFILGTYMLNILDANVSAHLMQFNVKDNLSVKPHFESDFLTKESNYGIKVLVKL